MVGDVIWHGRWCLFPSWDAFFGCCAQIIFGDMYISVSPQKHFLFIINLVGIASHSTCTFLSDYCINFRVYMLMCFHFWYLYILIFSIDCRCRDMAWQIEPLIFHSMLHWHFHWMDITCIIWHWYETHIYLTCVSISTSVSICYHIWMHNIIYIIHLSLFHVHVLSITYILIQYSI